MGSAVYLLLPARHKAAARTNFGFPPSVAWSSGDA